MFATLTMPALGGGLNWNTSQLYTTGVLSVVAPLLPGDYNADGSVDAADYVVWRKGLGTTHTPEDFNIWRAHFGETAASGSGAALGPSLHWQVPEPDSLQLPALGGMLWAIAAGIGRHRRLV